MKVLVTGATGFVGRYLVAELARRGDAVRCLVRPTSRREGLAELPGVEFFAGDVTDAASLAGLGEGVELAYHLCAEGHVSAVSEEAFRRFTKVNVEGTRNVLDACASAGVPRVLHFSSTAAMGLIKKPRVDETDRPEPRTPYQKSKLASEEAALAFWREQGMAVSVLRPCMIYGVGGKGEFHRICRLVRRGLFPRVGLGKNLTPLVHVTDVVQAALKAGEHAGPGEVYLVASARSFPLAELRSIILEVYGVKRPYWYVPAWAMYAGAWCAELFARAFKRTPVVTVRNIASTVWDRRISIDKARRELGYEPTADIREGVRRTVEWFEAEAR